MASIFNKSATTKEFRVPSLEESDSTYSALITKRDELNNHLRDLRDEDNALVQAIEADTSRDVRPSIASLLGDEPSPKAVNRRRLTEVRTSKSDHEAAIATVGQRIRDAHVAASRAACALVRPEFTKRVQAVVAAMKTLDEAHKNLDDLYQALEAEDISHSQFGQVKPFVLGAARSADRPLARYIKETEASGYGN